MILSIDTSTPTCFIGVHDGTVWHEYEWEAGRRLAKELLTYLQEALEKSATSIDEVSGIVAYQGPGSFTGLRIGLTVVNTLASAKHIPIVGETGEQWRQHGLERLSHGENDELVMPEYGGDPHITTPRK